MQQARMGFGVMLRPDISATLSIGRVMSDISLFGHFSLSCLFVLSPISRACSTRANQIRCKRTWEDGDRNKTYEHTLEIAASEDKI